MRLRQLLGAAAVAACLAGPVRADVNVYYHAGGWDAFDGQDQNGQPFCGIGSRNPADGRTFSLRFELGAGDVVFVASKTGWSIPDRTQIPVVMQVGLDRPWSAQGVGSGDRVQWTLDRASYPVFDSQFRGASSMTLTFPEGNEQPWIVTLAGSSAISTAMSRCVADLARRAAAGPAAAAPSPAPSTTQPFGAAPAAPASSPPPAQAPQGQPAGQPQAPQDNSQGQTQAPRQNGGANPSH